jgi:hypothetical protein
MNGSEPKRHHFVPQMLLRSFAAPDGDEQIWQLRVRDDSPPVRLAISNAAVVKNYYTHFRDRPHKENDLFWEKLMADWESKAAAALRELEADPDHIRGPAQALVVLQLIRTPLGQAQMALQAEANRRRVFSDPDGRVWMCSRGPGGFPAWANGRVCARRRKLLARAGPIHCSKRTRR